MSLKNIGAAIALLFVLFLTACRKEGMQITTRTLTVQDFNKVEFGGEFEVLVKYSPNYSVTLTGQERDLADIHTRLIDGKLIIDFTRYRSFRKKVQVTVTLPSLKEVLLTGVTTGRVEGFNEPDAFRAEVSGESTMQLDVNAPFLQLFASGISFITAQGTSDRIEAEASGRSGIDAYAVPVTKATVEASGESVAKVQVVHWIIADASGKSIIYYKGNPPQENLFVSGDSRIIKQ
ncbi:putative autotransporter adhesin-like protein [Lacibacter cauensis]|uniref:Putative autotransporter adhesin-like protein n=1 Tax=Lacibacter cauensis TaxID=510947 RepID=A0A562SGB2_9BACT|nr:head GIN domain-containing protein [Lacibacter cauensis]TWI80193.1 putative autotransporter adhesin-like protein [Lacibacter cauensis]